jgi:hypothetical protein
MFNAIIRITTTAIIFFMACNYDAKLIFANPLVNRINMCI